MHTTALVRILPAGAPDRRVLRALLQIARRAQGLAGFRQWQTFRIMDASGLLLVVLDWDSVEALKTAQDDPQIRRACERLAELGLPVPAPEILGRVYDRQLAPQRGVATLVRESRSSRAGKGAGQDSEFALRAMAAPGTTRLQGSRSRDGRTALCRIEFEAEDGIWHFLESPLRQAWSARSERLGETEAWGINLPRFEYLPVVDTSAADAQRAPLSVQLAVSEDGSQGQLKLQGFIDARGAARCEKLCQALIADGCLSLEVDVSALPSVSIEAAQMLARTARQLRAQGGHFTLTDDAERVKRITRARHLETSVR